MSERKDPRREACAPSSCGTVSRPRGLRRAMDMPPAGRVWLIQTMSQVRLHRGRAGVCLPGKEHAVVYLQLESQQGRLALLRGHASLHRQDRCGFLSSTSHSPLRVHRKHSDVTRRPSGHCLDGAGHMLSAATWPRGRGSCNHTANPAWVAAGRADAPQTQVKHHLVRKKGCARLSCEPSSLSSSSRVFSHIGDFRCVLRLGMVQGRTVLPADLGPRQKPSG